MFEILILQYISDFIYDNELRVVPHFLRDSLTERVKYSNVSENRCVRGEARLLEWKETEGLHTSLRVSTSSQVPFSTRA